MRYRFLLLSVLIFAACDNIAPTLTPTRPLSGPTLQASPTILPLLPAQDPTQLLYVGISNPTAAALPGNSGLPPQAAGTMAPGETHQPIQVTAPDGTLLQGDLYASLRGNTAPGVLMLAADNAGWLDLPLRLQDQGDNVLAMPLRPGESGATMLGDFEALIQALSQVSDPGHLAVIGAEAGADMGLAGCAAEPLCDALVLLSPTDQAIAQNTIVRYNPRPIFLAVAQSGGGSFGITEFLRGSAQGTVGYQAVGGSARGTALLQADPSLLDQLVEWLGGQLG